MNGDYREYDFNPMFSLIIENCNHLNETNIPMNYLNESNFQEFERKFGQQIKCLFQLKDEFNFNSFPDIEKLKLNPIDNRLIRPELKLNKLKKLEITISYGEQHILQTIIYTFPQLTHFIINFRQINVKTIFELLKCISNLKNLILLSFRAILPNINQLWDSFKHLSTDCPKLKTIECYFSFTKTSEIYEINSILKAFPELKRLDLQLRYTGNHCLIRRVFFEVLKGLSNITHLAIGWYCGRNLVHFNHNFLEENVFSPQLRYLGIENKLETEGEKELPDILSRLSRLESIKIDVKNSVFDYKPQQIEEEIRKKCKNIRTIKINYY